MRVADLAVFLIIFNSVFGVVMSAYGLTAVSIGYEFNVTAVQNITVTENVTAEQLQGEIFLVSLIRPLQILINVLASVFALGYFLKALFPIIPDSFAFLLTGVVDVIYALGIVQFVSNRSFKMMR